MSEFKGRVARCDGCGHEFLEADAPSTCPKCGSNKITKLVKIKRCTTSCGALQAVQTAPERGAIGYRESRGGGRSARADLTDDDLVRSSIAGSTPHGEEETGRVCRILAERLRDEGRYYGRLEPGREPADCILKDESTGRALRVQVVKAITDPKPYRELDIHGKVQMTRSAESILEEIRTAICHKSCQYPSTVKAELVLALDATVWPGVAFDAVVKVFRRKYSNWVKSQGFSEVWLVGPVKRLTSRLDE
jgi:hypothetical protein